ncbi:hypothetical protein CIW54_22535 [Paraburkholderia sp. T12-10]|nr:hypothetical protein CIW54_22535 [Paraburkholderia sp. T12-10]
MNAHIAAERAQRLDALSSASEGRSKTAQLRDVFDSVERAIRSGVRYAAIIEDLAQTGLVFSYQTFALTIKRLRRERGIVARAPRMPRSETDPMSTEATEATEASDAAPTRTSAPRTASATVTDAPPAPSALRRRPPIAPVGARLPDDWLTADLTREQKRLLTHEQRRARADAVVKDLWPNPFDPVPPKKEDPA